MWKYIKNLNCPWKKKKWLLLSKCNQSQRQRRLSDLVFEDVNNKLVLAQGICHLSLWWLNPVQLQLLTFDTFWREFRADNKNEALGAPGKLVEQVLVRYFQELTFWTASLHLFISRKALNSFVVTLAPCD